MSWLDARLHEFTAYVRRQELIHQRLRETLCVDTLTTKVAVLRTAAMGTSCCETNIRWFMQVSTIMEFELEINGANQLILKCQLDEMQAKKLIQGRLCLYYFSILFFYQER